MMELLYVFRERDLLGTLSGENGLTFTFSEDCIQGRVDNPFHSLIPVSKVAVSGPLVLAYFENLLPEGAQRSAVEKRFQVSSVFGLLQALSGETVGALTLSREKNFLPGGYIESSWKKVIRSEALIHEEDRGSGFQSNMISGAQSKILLHLDPQTGVPLLPTRGAPSSYILKPNIVHPTVKVWSSAINETLVMTLGRLCKLGVAQVKYIPEAKSCLVARFDRQLDQAGNWTRFHQTDFCQELGLASDRKYEKDGGPGFASCYNLVKERSTAPALDCLRLLNWLFFNLYTGNHDSHAKNLSFLYKGNEVRLSPFYDLMCTSLYTGLTRSFAFNLGGSHEPGAINAANLVALSKALGIPFNRLKKLSLDVATEVLDQLEPAAREVAECVPKKDQVVLERLQREIESNTRKISQRFCG